MRIRCVIKYKNSPFSYLHTLFVDPMPRNYVVILNQNAFTHLLCPGVEIISTDQMKPDVSVRNACLLYLFQARYGSLKIKGRRRPALNPMTYTNPDQWLLTLESFIYTSLMSINTLFSGCSFIIHAKNPVWFLMQHQHYLFLNSIVNQTTQCVYVQGHCGGNVV